MKRFFVISCLLIFLFCTAALCESYSTYSTGHFFFKAPTTWLKYKDGDNLFLYGGRYKSTDGGMLMASESYAGQFEEVDAFYSSFVSSFTAGTEGDKVTSESILINNEPAVHFSFQYPRANPFPMHSIACYKGGYVLSISYADTLSDEDTVKNVLFDIVNSVSFSDELGITDAVRNANYEEETEARIDSIASAVFGDTLITSRAGKAPTVSFKAVKDDILGTITEENDVLAFADEKILLFLEKFQKFCRSQPYYFEDLRFNVYTTFFDESTMDTTAGLILAFNISYDTILNQNFKNTTIDDLFDSGFNKYVHPFLQ